MNRFSLRTLLLAVAFVALAIVATMNANYWWVVATGALAYLLLATAIVGAFWAVGERRAFWSGFAVFGWALWLAGAVWSHVELPGWRLGDAFARGLGHIYPVVEDVDTDEYLTRKATLDVLSVNRDSDGVRYYRVRNKEYERHLGEVTNALLMIVAGVFGGAISAWFWRTGRKE